ncbi:prepilin peptidase [Jatrophihabitans endophyticus]|uniref:prepilin peptidase n=1 Tax=Jatrophihabitans endophyticus TaxID=1206085 RepID=UPI0019FC89F2|nr:prepilin peptidase [Jatrophihabitans endophyticus]MBE7189359.1 prepilin peptidase [Jatrophihabitans endophyticus]
MSPLILLAVLIGVLGLAVGSFLNVLIYRVPRNESVVSPPSHCPRCDSEILNRHNVPVLGWLVLRGRCHSCALPISARYPLIEAATGVAFAALTFAVGLSLALPVVLFLAAVAITKSMIAYDTRQAA